MSSKGYGMITVPAIDRVAELKLHSGDRRSDKRYPIRLDVEYKLCNRGRVEHFGVGRTVDVSSGGVLFETFGDVPVGRPIDLAIKWPFLLDEKCGLKLQLRGYVIRRDHKRIAGEDSALRVPHYGRSFCDRRVCKMNHASESSHRRRASQVAGRRVQRPGHS